MDEYLKFVSILIISLLIFGASIIIFGKESDYTYCIRAKQNNCALIKCLESTDKDKCNQLFEEKK